MTLIINLAAKPFAIYSFGFREFSGEETARQYPK
jgi:hypothetical protein